MKWKFWQRNTATPVDVDLPPEVQEYYQSTRRGRKGVAIVLGIVTVLVTLLLAAVLYFAGRYLWRTFFNDDEPTSITQQEQAPTPEAGRAPAEEPATTGTSSDATNEPAHDDSRESDSSNEADSLPSGETNSSDSDDDDTTTNSGKGDTPGSTPDTGPGDVFAIATGIAVASGAAYEVVARRKSQTK